MTIPRNSPEFTKDPNIDRWLADEELQHIAIAIWGSDDDQDDPAWPKRMFDGCMEAYRRNDAHSGDCTNDCVSCLICTLFSTLERADHFRNILRKLQGPISGGDTSCTTT